MRVLATVLGVLAFAVAVVGLVARYVPIARHGVLVLAAASPYLMVAGPVAVILLGLGGRWVLAVIAACLSVVMVGIQLPRYVGPETSAVPVAAVRVLTANLGLGRADPRAVVALARESADLLVVQEMTPEAATGLSSAGLDAAFPHRVLDPRDLAGGIGVWSRYPIVESGPIAGFSLQMLSARVQVPGVVTDRSASTTSWCTTVWRRRRERSSCPGPIIGVWSPRSTFLWTRPPADGCPRLSSVPVTAIYVASPEGDTGKSTIALGILHRLATTVAKVGVFRPITRLGEERDYILELLLAHTTVGLPYEDCVGAGYQQLHEDPDTAIADIVDRFHRVADQCDAVLIVGSDYTDVATPSELSVNARIAVNLGAPVVLSVRARDRTPDEVAQVVELCLAELSAQHAHTAAVVANRCRPSQMEAVAQALKRFDTPSYVLPEEPLLVAPTAADLQRAVDGTLVHGSPTLLGREVMGILVGGMTAEHVLERLTDGAAVITPGDRSDVVLAVASAHAAAGFPSLSAVILNGGLDLHPSIAALVAGLRLPLPMIATDLGTYETASAVASTRGRVAAGSQRKIDTALALMDTYVDTADLLARLAIPIPTVVTPQMFTYQLLDRARSDRKRIVLPEGDDDRILRAAARLLQRCVADLTILGDEDQIRSRAAELDVEVSGARLLNPRTSELCDMFAEQYAELRKHKGVTVEQAHEIIQDVSYFGTMLVHNDMVDGMVSGAAHTTAHTVRPAFEIIRTARNISTVSSIFLMCLADRVLAYGDCAIVPDPTAEQLADIAISSARTAAQFGIDPRVAMLSYSTGTSGTGADVDKVRTATELVRKREPDLLVEGPIQYDAAVEPSVAATKMPGSEVAGRATVLIFPDLNTGNNTYKAVQRSAGAIVIGPVLQGLNKPVNDLSRGALVEDIVNTVAITAIQAQGK